MSTIETGIIGPGNGKKSPPGVIPPLDGPEGDHVGSGEIEEPSEEDVPPIHPDPEEGRRNLPDIRRR